MGLLTEKNEAVYQFLKETATPIPDDICRMVDGNNNFKPSLAIVGEFKVGKSTFINKAFLNENLLFTDVLEATAIPTAISRSVNNQLIVTNFDSTTPEIIEAPNSDTIKSYTSAESPDAAEVLTKSISSVELKLNKQNLDNLIIIDTPGINSINEAVVTTTYNIIPSVDLAVFMTKARQMSDIELRFLQSNMFAKGISRIMLLVNYNSEFTSLSDSAIQDIEVTIKSQLASIGRDYIPVKVFSINGKDSAKKQVASLDEIRREIVSFANDNFMQARNEKLDFAFSGLLKDQLFKLQTKLAFAEKSESERKQALGAIETASLQLKNKYDDIEDRLIQGIQRARRSFQVEVKNSLSSIRENCLLKLNRLEDMSEIKNYIDSLPIDIQLNVENTISTAVRNLENRLKTLTEETEGVIVDSLAVLSSIKYDDLTLDAGILGKISPTLVTIIDYGVIVALPIIPGTIISAPIVGPLSFLAGFPIMPSAIHAGLAILSSTLSTVSIILGSALECTLRYVVGKIPLMKKLMISNIFGDLLKSKVKSAVDDMFLGIEDKLFCEVENKLDDFRSNIQATLEKELGDSLVDLKNQINASDEKQMSSTAINKLHSQVEKIKYFLYI